MTDAAATSSKRTVLVVDDTPDNLAFIAALLSDQYRVKVANSGPKALAVARSADPPDLILLDVMMPGMSGFEVCEQLKADPGTAGIPVVFLTANTGAEDEKRGFDIGGADYITKPISPAVTIARVRTHLENKLAADFMRDQNAYLETEVQRRVKENAAMEDVSLLTLAVLAENRDTFSFNRILRMRSYVRTLANRLAALAVAHADLSPNTIELLARTAPLHNIGEIGIPDRIRLYPGKPSAEDHEVFKTHTRIGRDLLARAAQTLGVDLPILRVAQEMAYAHHERWDGFGYPEGLAGEQIPLGARLVAVADAYDGQVFPGIYDTAATHDEAVKAVENAAGTHLDPDVVLAFTAEQETFRDIAQQLGDSDEDRAHRIRYMEQAIAEQV
jgi:putative two-component system response regulator